MHNFSDDCDLLKLIHARSIQFQNHALILNNSEFYSYNINPCDKLDRF